MLVYIQSTSKVPPAATVIDVPGVPLSATLRTAAGVAVAAPPWHEAAEHDVPFVGHACDGTFISMMNPNIRKTVVNIPVSVSRAWPFIPDNRDVDSLR
jgi:hypothetical protein